MRDILCDILRQYLDQGEGKRTVFFSTHNIADMENVTDYAIIMEHGQVMEQGFVEDLKEKYTVVKGEAKDADGAAKILYTMSRNTYGFEGVCLSEKSGPARGDGCGAGTPQPVPDLCGCHEGQQPDPVVEEDDKR